MNITEVKRYYITEMILLSSDIWHLKCCTPLGFVALLIYSPFYTHKMIDTTDNQFMNVFAKFR